MKLEEHQKNKLLKVKEKERCAHSILMEHGREILESEEFQSTKQHIQHGTMSVHHHCINVAKYAVAINEKLHLKGNVKEIVRGALLHDYFLYDWHEKEHEGSEHLHGFHHPKVALKNATRDFKLTKIEKDIIEKHMWPLTLSKIPACRESWIVTAADKYCSLLETLKIHKGKKESGIESDLG